MTQDNTTPPSNDPRREVSDNGGDAADRFSRAAGTMDRAAASVHSNLTSGIQPDMRELRLLMADLRDTVAIAFRRIFWAVIACIVLNVVVLVAILAR